MRTAHSAVCGGCRKTFAPRRARIEREGLRGEAVVLDVARDGEDDDGPIVTLTLDVSVPGARPSGGRISGPSATPISRR
jgi:hypothetical protein